MSLSQFLAVNAISGSCPTETRAPSPLFGEKNPAAGDIANQVPVPMIAHHAMNFKRKICTYVFEANVHPTIYFLHTNGKSSYVHARSPLFAYIIHSIGVPKCARDHYTYLDVADDRISTAPISVFVASQLLLR
jgi:hypothetical protein